MADFAERLALIIDAKTAGAVTELKKVTKSSEDLAVQQDRAALSSAKMSAAQDKLAASLAKQQVAEAKASGDTAKLAEAQTASAAATEKANLSKAQAAIAADKLAVSQLTAKDATAALGVEATASGGMLDKLGLSAVGLGEALTALTPLLILAAVAAVGKALIDGVKKFEELTNQVRTFKAVTGATATEASLLVGQMKQLGVDPDTAAKAFQRFGAAIGDGSSKINEFGVVTAHSKDGTVDLVATLENLRVAYQNAGDASRADAIAKQLGLRQATALIPLLQANRKEIEALNAATRRAGGLVSDKDIQNGLKLKIAGNELKQSFNDLEIGLAKGFVPTLARGLTLVSDIVTKLAEAGDKWSSLHKNGGPFEALYNALGHIPDPLGIRTSSGQDGGTKAEQKAAADAAVAKAEEVTAAQDKLTQSLTGQLDANRAVRDATNQLVDAQQNEVDAQAALDKLLKDGAVDAKEVAAAQKELASASKAVTHAQEEEQSAQEALNKARQRASALDLAEANNKLALAGDHIASAKAAEQEAREKLDALMGSGNATAGQIAAAQAEVAAKHDETTQSVIDQQRATEDLTKVQQKGTAQDPAVIDAQRRVRDAHDAVKDAIDNQKDALDRLHTAEAGDPDYARKLADARHKLADAHQAIADAQDNQVTAALRLKDATEKLNAALAGSGGGLMALQVEAGVLDELMKLRGQGLDVGPLLGLLPDLVNDAFGNPVGISGTGALAAPPKHRAKGGPLEPFQAYLVAESGTGGEILQMGDSGGYATPVGKSKVELHSHLHVDGGISSRMMQELVREQTWQLRTTILPRVETAA